jgi:hypothetical protein
MKKHYRCDHGHVRRQWTIMFVILMAFVFLPQAWAADSGDGQGAVLTKYLHTHRLPLVSAQITEEPDGSREVVLYGFTATDFGKEDAETKSRRFLNDRTVTISNRIKVRPELANHKSAPSSLPSETAAGSADEYSGQEANPDAASRPANPDGGGNFQDQSQGDIQSYANQQQQQQPYRQQPGMGGMGGGSGQSFGSSGTGMGGGGLGALLGGGGMGAGGGGLGGLLGLLGRGGGSGSYGSGPGERVWFARLWLLWLRSSRLWIAILRCSKLSSWRIPVRWRPISKWRQSA